MTGKSNLTALALLATALIGTSGAAGAAEPAARGFYVGASGGTTSFEDDGMFGGFDYDDSDSGWGVYGGYKFLKYLSAEARYTDVGFESTILSGHVVGIVPFGASGWELFGELGVGSADIDWFDTETVYSAGLGVRFYPTSHLGVSLQTDAWVFEDDDRNPGFGATQLAVHWLF